jgi:hypothetical protein
MVSRKDLLREGLRYDPGAWRRSQRHGKQKGVTITIPAAELRAAGIDPDGPPPVYRTKGASVRGHRVIVNLHPG